VVRTTILLACLLVLAVSAADDTAAQDDPRLFSQTGFRIDDDAFWNFFQQRGGVRTFGLPVSRSFTLDGFTVQMFQRLVMQRQPDGSVSTLNLLDPDVLPVIRVNGSTFPGQDPALVAATPRPTDPDYATTVIQFVSAHAPNTFDGLPVNFSTTFSTTVSLQDAFPNGDGTPSLLPLLDLELWGTPTSVPTPDPTNANFVYLRFQRGIMQFDRNANTTQGVLVGDFFKSVMTGQDLPADLAQATQGSRFFLQYAPDRPLSIDRPTDLPSSNLTNAFEPQQTPTPPPTAFAYGFQVQMAGLGQDMQALTVSEVGQAGFGWLKHQVVWADIETTPGQFDFSQFDAIVDQANAAGLKVLLSVVRAPAFYRSPASGLMPADPTRFQLFMQALAARYRGRVQAYELWNEENLDREAGPGNVAATTYLPLLRAGHAGVKAGDPGATVLLGAPSPTGVNSPGAIIDDLSYLQQLYALNGGEARAYFDAVSAHPSGFSNPPDCTPATPQCSLSGGFNNDPSFFAFTRVSQYRRLMILNGDSAKQIWFTEFGYCSNPTPPAGFEYCMSITEQQQAQFLVQAFQFARRLAYVGAMFQWNLNFQLVVPQTSERWGFGILRSDGVSPRPAYSALLEMPKL
jgi:polysaccharide biosynthesis protein PslG